MMAEVFDDYALAAGEYTFSSPISVAQLNFTIRRWAEPDKNGEVSLRGEVGSSAACFFLDTSFSMPEEMAYLSFNDFTIRCDGTAFAFILDNAMGVRVALKNVRIQSSNVGLVASCLVEATFILSTMNLVVEDVSCPEGSAFQLERVEWVLSEVTFANNCHSAGWYSEPVANACSHCCLSFVLFQSLDRWFRFQRPM
ncbi:hypothetical protein QOT17_007087 [Balamuthia mandrillaris]